MKIIQEVTVVVTNPLQIWIILPSFRFLPFQCGVLILWILTGLTTITYVQKWFFQKANHNTQLKCGSKITLNTQNFGFY